MRTEWYESEAHHCGCDNQEWSDFINETIGLFWNHVLFGQEFHAVGDVREKARKLTRVERVLSDLYERRDCHRRGGGLGE